MRKLLLTGTALLLLSGGAALAGEGGGPGGPGGPGASGGTTNTTTVTSVTKNLPIKNATSSGSGTNSSATTGSTAVSAALTNSANTSGSNNPSNSDNSSLSVLKVIGSNYAADGSTLSTTRSYTTIDVKLATSSNQGTVEHNVVVYKPKFSSIASNATETNVNGGTGIMTAQQNTGANAMQQSSVALGSYISGSSNNLP